MHPSCVNEGAVPFRVKLDREGMGNQVDPPSRDANGNWTKYIFSFQATENTHHVSFESDPTSDGKCGAVIANVRATQAY